MTHPPNQDQPADALPFDEALEKIEEIINNIESGDIGLERALDEYEQGVRLMNHCRAILAKAELRITELNRRLDEPAHENTSKKRPAPPQQ